MTFYEKLMARSMLPAADDNEALLILSLWQREAADRLRSRMPTDEWTAYESLDDVPDDPDDYLAEADEEEDEPEEEDE